MTNTSGGDFSGKFYRFRSCYSDRIVPARMSEWIYSDKPQPDLLPFILENPVINDNLKIKINIRTGYPDTKKYDEHECF